MNRYKNILLSGLAVIILGLLYFIQNPQADKIDYLKSKYQSVYMGIQAEAAVKSPEALLNLIEEGIARNEISNDECHSLLHQVGHRAYQYYAGDFSKILSIIENGHRCVGGFVHGVESEVILQRTDYISDLRTLCQELKKQSKVPGYCYHGAGHSFLDAFDGNTNVALENCDKLGNDNNKAQLDVISCYRGVFSEMAASVLGVDTHTGFFIDPKPFASVVDKLNPYGYCKQFASKYIYACQTQLSQVVYSMGDHETFIERCINPNFEPGVQQICIEILSGVNIRGKLSYGDYALLPNSINDLNQEYIKAAISGGVEAYLGYKLGGFSSKDWKPFCSQFEKDMQAHCISEFNRNQI